MLREYILEKMLETGGGGRQMKDMFKFLKGFHV